MASFKFELAEYVKKNGKQAIMLRIIAARAKKPKHTGFEILAKHWDAGKERVKPSYHGYTELNDALRVMLENAETAHSNLVSGGKIVTAAAINEKAFALRDFYKIADGIIAAFPPERYRSKKKYETLIAQLKEFKPVLNIEEITPDFVKVFRKHLEAPDKEGWARARNTIINRLGTLRALLNQAGGDIDNPFDKVTIGDFKASHDEPLTVAEITALWNYDPVNDSQKIARDTFLFSFYAAGMRSEDVLTLTWAEVKDGYLVFDQAKKMHQNAPMLRVPLNQWLDAIISRYRAAAGPTIFNLVDTTLDFVSLKKKIESKQATINLQLKLIAQKLGITKNIKFKLARSTFADIANKRSNRNVYAIQQSLGHSRMKTTEIYLGQDQSAIDELLQVVYKK